MFNLFDIASVFFVFEAVDVELQAFDVFFFFLKKFDSQMVEFGSFGLQQKTIHFIIVDGLAYFHEFDQVIFRDEKMLVFVDDAYFSLLGHGPFHEVLIELEVFLGLVQNFCHAAVVQLLHFGDIGSCGNIGYEEEVLKSDFIRHPIVTISLR